MTSQSINRKIILFGFLCLFLIFVLSTIFYYFNSLHEIQKFNRILHYSQQSVSPAQVSYSIITNLNQHQQQESLSQIKSPKETDNRQSGYHIKPAQYTKNTKSDLKMSGIFWSSSSDDLDLEKAIPDDFLKKSENITVAEKTLSVDVSCYS